MRVVRSLQDYLSVVSKHRRVVVVGENCVDCHVFLERYSRCLEGFEVVLLPIDMDEGLLEYFFSVGVLGVPVVVIDGRYFWGDIDYLGEVVCGSS